jgi:hypothetical protein
VRTRFENCNIAAVNRYDTPRTKSPPSPSSFDCPDDLLGVSPIFVAVCKTLLTIPEKKFPYGADFIEVVQEPKQLQYVPPKNHFFCRVVVDMVGVHCIGDCGFG